MKCQVQGILIALLGTVILQNASAGTVSGENPGVKFLRGFMRPLDGDRLEYHCFNPLATTALLTRCTTGEMKISWETEPLPADTQDPFVTFKWVVSYSTMTSAGDRSFDFLINGKKAFVIRTRKGDNPARWVLQGDHGAELVFEFVTEDAARDANGYMYLKVPVSDYTRGVPLKLTVVGEKASSSDWFMTFMYDLREAGVEVLPLPYLVKGDSGLHQVVAVVVTYAGEKGEAVVAVDGGEGQRMVLARGSNTLNIQLPAVQAPKEFAAAVSVNNAPAELVRATIRPVTARTIYLLPHAHTDIGYTDIQTEVLKKHVRNIYDALALIRSTASYPPEARFKWNTEVSWAVEAFLAGAGKADREEFLAAVRHGSISIQALYANNLTGIMRPEEYFRLTGYSRSLQAKYGIPITTAMMSDVPGMSWNMVPAVAQAGVRYFSSGPNGTYLGGDRTGHTNRSWADRPFYWVSPSGGERILYWMTGFGYGSFFAGMTSGTGQRIGFLRSLTKYFEWLDEIGYPYDIIHMRHTINGDNGTVDPDLPQYVRSWNERYVSPRIVIATAEQVFGELEKRYGELLPSYSGDFTPYWEDGAASSAYELGLTRTTSEQLVQTEALAAMISPGKYDRAAFEEAWKQVLLFNEHTWGAHNSISDPDSAFQMGQWRIKRGFSVDAARASETLRTTILGPRPEHGDAVEILNTSSWPRTDLVRLPGTESKIGDIVRDEKGSMVPSQRLSTGELAFIAADVPPLGARRYTLHPGATALTNPLRVSETSIADGTLEVRVDPASGSITSLRTVSPAHEFADSARGGGLNEYLYVDGIDAREVARNGAVSIAVRERGPILASIMVTSDAPGCNRLSREIRLVTGTGRVDVVNTIDKRAVRTKEGVHFGFPFAVPEGVTRIDLGYAVVRPEADQLPGSCKDYVCAQRWVDVSNQDRGVTLTVAEAPLVEIGELNSEIPSPRNPYWLTSQPSSPRLASYVMNNYWHTNYKADQEGISTYHYTIQPHGQYDRVSITRAGIERSQPLVVRWVRKGDPLPERPFTVGPRNVLVSYLKPLDKGRGYVARLFNAGGTSTVATVTPGRAGRVAHLSSLSEEKVPGTLTIPANGIVTVVIE